MTEPTKLVRLLNWAGSAFQASSLQWWGPCSPDAASALWSALRPASRPAGHERRPR